ncbi:MAG: autotransporter assembly complex family protein [Oceanococcaceae bacterium]
MLWAVSSPGWAFDVRVLGVDGAVAKSVQASLGIALLPGDANPRLIRRRHAQASQQIRTALQAFGYYSPEIAAELRDDLTPPQAIYRIQPGPRAQWARAEIRLLNPVADGAAPRWLTRAQQQAEARLGQPLDHRDYSRIKTQLIDAAQNDGYLDAQYQTSVLEIDRDAHTATMRLVLETGPQYRFGKVRIEQDILNADFLERFDPVREGDVFNTDELLELRLRLYDLNYFQEVEVDPHPNAETQRVDVNIRATARKPQRWQIGLGYGTDTGPRISGAVELRYLNRRGHQADARATVSEVKTELGLRYVLPTGPEPGANWAVRTQRLTERLGDTETTTLRTGVARNRIFDRRLWNFYLNYEGERFRLENRDTRTDLIIPGISLTLRDRDDLLLPRKGYTVFLDVHGAADELISSTQFLQVQVNANWIRPLSRRSRLIVRGRAGANWLDDTEDLPVSQRFFAGGDGSIRGYDYRRIAPRNDDGEIVGGKYLQTVSVEVDRLIWRDYGVALFHDMGSASNNWLSNFVSATGVGLRWATPVGMLRVDVATPHDDPNTRFQLHIGIGGEL